jgi:transcription antitermination factor NusG
MPLLPKEPEILPADIFSLAIRTHPWGVAHVRSRQEKVLARYLAEQEIPFYLPTTTVRRKRAGRTLTSHLPLFAGYVFHRAPDARRDLIWRSNVVANLIEVPDQVQLGEELAQLRSLQESGASFKLYHALLPGEPVRIVEGVFAGYSGVVVRAKGQERLIVSVSLLRQAVSVEFDREVVQRR